jgi:hypothetical protein
MTYWAEIDMLYAERIAREARRLKFRKTKIVARKLAVTAVFVGAVYVVASKLEEKNQESEETE